MPNVWGMTQHDFPDLPGQSGLATRRQLLELGWSDDGIRHLVSTRGRRVFPGVVAPHRSRLSDDVQLVAARLWAGPDAALTGCAALGRHGLELPRTPAVQRFLIPIGKRARSFSVAVTARTSRLTRLRSLDGVTVTGISRALADAARYAELTPDEASALTLQALQRRLESVARVEEELLASRHNGLKGVWAGAREYRKGAWSVAEARMIRLVSTRPRLGPMLANPRLTTGDGCFIGIPDGYFVAEEVAVQVHSSSYHDGVTTTGVDRWARTVEADTRFERHGIVVVGVAPATLDRDPQRFLDALADVLAAHRGRPALDVRIE